MAASSRSASSARRAAASRSAAAARRSSSSRRASASRRSAAVLAQGLQLALGLLRPARHRLALRQRGPACFLLAPCLGLETPRALALRLGFATGVALSFLCRFAEFRELALRRLGPACRCLALGLGCPTRCCFLLGDGGEASLLLAPGLRVALLGLVALRLGQKPGLELPLGCRRAKSLELPLRRFGPACRRLALGLGGPACGCFLLRDGGEAGLLLASCVGIVLLGLLVLRFGLPPRLALPLGRRLAKGCQFAFGGRRSRGRGLAFGLGKAARLGACARFGLAAQLKLALRFRLAPRLPFALFRGGSQFCQLPLGLRGPAGRDLTLGLRLPPRLGLTHESLIRGAFRVFAIQALTCGSDFVDELAFTIRIAVGQVHLGVLKWLVILGRGSTDETALSRGCLLVALVLVVLEWAGIALGIVPAGVLLAAVQVLPVLQLVVLVGSRVGLIQKRRIDHDARRRPAERLAHRLRSLDHRRHPGLEPDVFAPPEQYAHRTNSHRILLQAWPTLIANQS